MRIRTQFLFLALITVNQLNAQSVGIGTTMPDPSAVLDVAGSKGLLLPRLTAAERDAIENPANGLVIFCTSDNAFYSFNGSWKKLVAISTDELEGYFIGHEAGLSNTTGTRNHFTGYMAGRSNISGNRNHFSGHRAGFSNTTGSFNLFIGNQAGELNTIGTANVYAGSLAGAISTAGHANAFVGAGAGSNNSTGSYNAYFGYSAGSQSLGSGNTFLGARCGEDQRLGSNNVYVGYSAGPLGDGLGSGNVFVGYDAGSSARDGSNNVLIGNRANVNGFNINNAGAIGYNAVVSQSNSFVIGGTGEDAVKVGIGITAPTVTLHVNGVVGGIGPFLNLSDARLKTNMEPVTNALAGILQLQPVKYDWKKESYPQFNFEDKRQIGFLAQELEKIFPEAVTLGADGFYTIAYSELIPVVVRGMQEQQQQIETLQSENDQLKTALKTLQAEIEAIKGQLSQRQK